MLQQRLNTLQATQTERGMLVTLGDVLFESNHADIKPGAQGSLRKLADFLHSYPKRGVLIGIAPTASARRRESVSLAPAEPMLSVWPSAKSRPDAVSAKSVRASGRAWVAPG